MSAARSTRIVREALGDMADAERRDDQAVEPDGRPGRAPSRRRPGRRRRSGPGRPGSASGGARAAWRRCVSRTGRPSTSRPSGPALGEANVAVLVLWVLRTNRAAWTWSLNATRAPSPRKAVLAATWTAASRLAAPSGPAIAGLRIAPVTTTGVSCGQSRSMRYAVSSRVSVPWTTTIPSASTAPAVATSSRTSANDRSRSAGCGSCAARARRRDRRAAGTEATRSDAVSRDTTPPWWPGHPDRAAEEEGRDAGGHPTTLDRRTRPPRGGSVEHERAVRRGRQAGDARPGDHGPHRRVRGGSGARPRRAHVRRGVGSR